MTAAIDITAGQRKTLLALLRRYIPGVAVWAYGSRVKWTARPNSDLDLVAFTTPEQQPLVSELKEALAESDLPFLVDFHVWDDVPESFHEIIRKEYVVLLEDMQPEVISGIAGNTRATIYGDIATDFAEDRLVNLCVPDGGVQTGPFGSQLHQEDYVEVGTPIITVEHLGENRILHEGLPRVSDQDKNRLAKYALRNGDIVFSRVGSVDRRALVRDAENGWLFSGRCLRVRPDPTKIDSGYLSYFFGLPSFKEHIRAIAVGATMPSLNTQLLSNIIVPHPRSIYVQHAITHILGSLDDKIELNQRMNATLEAMARALFQSWFVDFDPVRAKLDGRQPAGLDAATAALFPAHFQESQLGHIPQGWEVKTADEVSIVGIGKTPPRKEHHWFSEEPSDVPWMSIRDLGEAGVYISQTSEFLTTEAVEKFRVKRIPDDTVVLSFKLTMGRVAITDGEMLSNEAIAHFRIKPETSFGSAYLYCYLKGFGYDQLGSTSSIATAINSDMVRGIRVLVPPKSIAEAFERTVKPLFTQMKITQKQSRTLATLRDELLPKLLSGELPVKPQLTSA